MPTQTYLQVLLPTWAQLIYTCANWLVRVMQVKISQQGCDKNVAMYQICKKYKSDEWNFAIQI